MTRRGTNISLKSYEDIFTTEEKRQETGEQVVMIPVNQIHEFKITHSRCLMTRI